MNDTDAIIDALLTLQGSSTADPPQRHAWVNRLTEGYKSIGQDAAIRHAFAINPRAASGLAGAWQSYAEQMEIEALELTEESLAVGLALARLTRNCLAGSHEAKSLVSRSEPCLRRAIFMSTSFGAIKEERFFPLQRALLQAIANLIAPVSRDDSERLLASNLFRIYSNEEKRADQIMLRSFDSSDTQVNLSVLMLISNALKSDPSLVETLDKVHGTKIMARILDKMAKWSDFPSETLEGRCFDLSYQIAATILPTPIQTRLFEALGSHEEVVTPSQLMFLKLLDGYLQSSTAQRSDLSEEVVIPDISYLIPYLDAATVFAASSLKQILDSQQNNGNATDEDPILPRTLEGSILLCQCLIASALREIPLDHERELLARQIAGFSTPAGSILGALRQEESRNIETLIALLGALEAALPRQKPFRSESEPKPSHSLQAFATLKRDVVQLLGLIAYHDKASQDRIREAAGIHLILSLCVVDEYNPLIREHALLAIRNLMMNNPENQAVVDTMDPIGMVGPDGELREMPSRLE